MNRIMSRVLAGVLIVILACAGEPLLVAQQPAQNQTQPSGQSTLPPVELPENPGRSSAQQQTPQQSPPPTQPAQTQPSGTAVAPQVEVSGGAASKPAGVAIAPPKQRQVRSLLIKLGLLAGAGVAIGTVVGLSAASPGRVPNSGH